MNDQHDGGSAVSLAFVVTTLGRIELLNNLLSSLVGQLRDVDRIVVVAQRNVDEVRKLASRFKQLPISVITSERGAALGRNTGVESLGEGDSVLIFPNDSTWFPTGAVDRIRREVAGEQFRMGAMTVIDEIGPKLQHPATGSPLTIFGVWRVIEMGLLIRKSSFDELGGFDPLLGTGAPTVWQSGESADLLLRALIAWPELSTSFRWAPVDVWVGGVKETHGLSKGERRKKLRAYGRGAGKISRDYNYPLKWKARLLAGGATLGLRNSQYSPLDGLWAFVGRLEGLLGRPWGQGTDQAIDR